MRRSHTNIKFRIDKVGGTILSVGCLNRDSLDLTDFWDKAGIDPHPKRYKIFSVNTSELADLFAGSSGPSGPSGSSASSASSIIGLPQIQI